MRLSKLTLKNFKGIRELSIDAHGQDTDVFGANGLGKTTVSDGVHWLLFDKDSNHNSKFEIKTLDAAGNVLHGLEHEVEGVFLLDNGKTITLRKVYQEKWTKKRGSATQEFTGHTTDYFVDGVPKKANEFKQAVAEIANEEQFKLLTSPAFFAAILPWKDRRQILMTVCGDITDQEVIAGNPDLSDLTTILNGRKLEDHKKVADAKRAAINKELQKIPVRVDEVTKGAPDVSGLDEKALSAKASELRGQIESLQRQKVQVESGGVVASKTKELREAEAGLQMAKNEALGGHQEAIFAKQDELTAAKNAQADASIVVHDLNRQLETTKKDMAEQEAQVVSLREEWHEVNESVHPADDTPTVCGLCGQSIPGEQVEATRQKVVDAFNSRKAERLKDINTAGQVVSAAIGELKAKAETIGKEFEVAKADLDAKTEAADAIAATIEEMRASQPDVSKSPAYAAAADKVASIQAEIDALTAGTADAAAAITEQIDAEQAFLSVAQAGLQKIEAAKKATARVEELKADERRLSAEYETAERELYLMEQFTRAKVEMLEGKINSRFQMARFKLFSEQINGGLSECCEVLYQGVPYSGGLNNAARIAVGLDIISTLSEHYGISMPVFVDNAESITDLPAINSQVIRLVVSKEDKALRVERHDEMEKAA